MLHVKAFSPYIQFSYIYIPVLPPEADRLHLKKNLEAFSREYFQAVYIILEKGKMFYIT
jgi:hypothetical protein